MNTLRKLLISAIFSITFAGLSCQVQAAGNPVRMYVIVAPGGSADAMARMVGEKISLLLDTIVIVENKPGAGGNLATQTVARAAPDGTALLVTANNHTINPSLFADAGYTIDDLVPIADLMWGPSVIVVPAHSPYLSLNQLLTDAKNRPEAITFGSAGIGTPSHIAGAMLNQAANIKLTHVPYRGSGPSLADLAGNQIPVVFSSLVAAMPLIQAGKIRPLAVTSSKRWPGSDNIPTVAESGLPDFAHMTFIGLFAPKGTTDSQAENLSSIVMQALANEAVRAKVASLGGEVGHMHAQEFKKYIDADYITSSQIVQSTGMKAD